MNNISEEPKGDRSKGPNFIESIIENDLRAGKNNGKVVTRFPPEPNGYLHIGHAKAICLDFGMAEKYGGICNLRFDDTNPVKESVEYIDSIKEDIRWLGFDWGDREFYASDYFDKLYKFAEALIEKGLAYVDDQSSEDIASQKGTPTQPGKESPFRNRSAAESLDLFQKMNRGEFPEGSRVLRAKIDMASPNMHMRDPVIYRIIKAPHHRTGSKWNVYPMYDFAHGQSDYFEGITHSLCTLEFEVHRPLYDWLIDQLKTGDYRPRQIEFNRLNLTYTVMSKRLLLQLVNEREVSGWDDPRMPTLSGMRRRGYTPEAIKKFITRIGYTKVEALNDIGLLEHAVREHLNQITPRVFAVLDPLKVVITNYQKSGEEIELINNPEEPSMGSRKIPFGREIYIERSDFMEDPPGKFFRLKPGGEVRLKGAYVVVCDKVVKDAATGEVTEVHCSYLPETRSGGAEANRKVKGTIHWVPVSEAIDIEVRLYDRLFVAEEPTASKDVDFRQHLNPESLKIITAKAEPSLAEAKHGDLFQFQRLGYYCVDSESTPEAPVFNQTVTLKDRWGKR